MVAATEIIAENFAPSQWLSLPRSSIRVVDWNIDRGLQLALIIDFLREANADIVILQEVDINARRTQRLNIAQEIARKLRLHYVFAREFVELTQGYSLPVETFKPPCDPFSSAVRFLEGALV
jgi:hypothetical protein